MKFFNWAVLDNRWLWFHMAAGAVLAKVLLEWFSAGTIFGIILFIAVVWEILEYFVSDVVKIYGSRAHFYADATGDVVGAISMVGLVIF